MPLSVVQDRRTRGKFKEWRDGMAANPRKADYAWTVLARVLAVAKDRGLIAVNVCERGGRLYEADRADGRNTTARTYGCSPTSNGAERRKNES
jgi:hypothetical protein